MQSPSVKETHAAHEHHSPMPYVLTGAALFGLTILTYFLSGVDLGAIQIPVALTIALVKGGLVAYIFMHLNEHGGVNALIFVTAILFVIILIVGLILDPVMRDEGQHGFKPPPATEFQGLDDPGPLPPPKH